MKMVVVSLVVIGAENHVEKATGSIPQAAKKSRATRIASCPIALDCNLLPVGENEACNVDGIGRRMLTSSPSCPMIHIAARIRSEMRDTHHILIEMMLGGRQQNMRLEQSPGHCERTGGRETAAQAHSRPGYFHGIR